ncbi:MAG: hypothetical protein HOG49_13375 [Candidatus Scalindua sp.]|nr:hypothetical protein [Candidatus Scalindua sp.]
MLKNRIDCSEHDEILELMMQIDVTKDLDINKKYQHWVQLNHIEPVPNGKKSLIRRLNKFLSTDYRPIHIQSIDGVQLRSVEGLTVPVLINNGTYTIPKYYKRLIEAHLEKENKLSEEEHDDLLMNSMMIP